MHAKKNDYRHSSSDVTDARTEPLEVFVILRTALCDVHTSSFSCRISCTSTPHYWLGVPSERKPPEKRLHFSYLWSFRLEKTTDAGTDSSLMPSCVQDLAIEGQRAAPAKRALHFATFWLRGLLAFQGVARLSFPRTRSRIRGCAHTRQRGFLGGYPLSQTRSCPCH